MTLHEFLETKRGLPYNEILAAAKEETVDVIKTIEGPDLKDVVTVLCSGLEYRIEQAPLSPVRTALLRAFNSMSIPGFGFNLNHTLVVQLLDAGVAAGLIDENERLWFYGIATKQEPKYPSVTMKDVITYFEPSLINTSNWEYLGELSQYKLRLQLIEEQLEPTLIRVEMSESADGQFWTEYKRVSHFYGVHKPDFYFAILPEPNGLRRKFRVKGEDYTFIGIVTAV